MSFQAEHRDETMEGTSAGQGEDDVVGSQAVRQLTQLWIEHRDFPPSLSHLPSQRPTRDPLAEIVIPGKARLKDCNSRLKSEGVPSDQFLTASLFLFCRTEDNVTKSGVSSTCEIAQQPSKRYAAPHLATETDESPPHLSRSHPPPAKLLKPADNPTKAIEARTSSLAATVCHAVMMGLHPPREQHPWCPPERCFWTSG